MIGILKPSVIFAADSTSFLLAKIARTRAVFFISVRKNKAKEVTSIIFIFIKTLKQ